jgi:predicted nuclease of restriction endonuclease-like (RecB) superfamily
MGKEGRVIVTNRPRTKLPKVRPKKATTLPRSSTALTRGGDFAALVDRVVAIIEEGRSRVARTVNSEMVLSYWQIGREIVEYVQRGSPRADYGEQVIEGLSDRLQALVGKGYSTTNLRNFRLFYLRYKSRHPEIRQTPSGDSALVPIRQTLSGEFTAGFSPSLSWSHYHLLCQVESPDARAFYEIEAERERWPVRHLERQIHTQLHLRLLKSRDKAGVMELARRGQTVERPIDLMKSPVVLDFLGLPDSSALRESDLETAIINKLSQFLLELGKGFAFVARQKRLTFEDEDFFVDLVFYNVILKCYLLVDLKLGKLTHQDVGQMDSYVRLFDAQGRTPGDGPTIGLILCAEKNEAIARYSILNEHKQLFAAKYVTYLPTEEELRRELERDRRIAEALVDAVRVEKPSKAKRAARSKGRKN